MNQIPRRLVRRLDDGRAIYRPHQRAKAVILSSAEYERVEGMALRSHVLQVVFALAICLAAAVAFASPPMRSFAVAIAALLVVAVWLIERRHTRAMRLVLDRAPVSVADNLEPHPSIAQRVMSLYRFVLSGMGDRQLRSLTLGLGLLFLASVWSLVSDFFGIDNSKRGFHPLNAILLILLCPVALKALRAERRRRDFEKAEQKAS